MEEEENVRTRGHAVSVAAKTNDDCDKHFEATRSSNPRGGSDPRGTKEKRIALLLARLRFRERSRPTKLLLSVVNVEQDARYTRGDCRATPRPPSPLPLFSASWQNKKIDVPSQCTSTFQNRAVKEIRERLGVSLDQSSAGGLRFRPRFTLQPVEKNTWTTRDR